MSDFEEKGGEIVSILDGRVDSLGYPGDIIHAGIRLRVDQLTGINTGKQTYRIKGMLDRDWIATEKDVKDIKELQDKYKPTVVPGVGFVNEVSLNIYYPIDPKTGSRYMIIKGNDGNYYNRLRIEFYGTFTDEMEVYSFPFDVQDLTFAFSAEQLPSDKLKFVPMHTKSSSISVNKTFSSITDWEIVNTDIHTCAEDELYAISGNKNKGSKDDIFEWVIFRIQVQRRWKTIFNRIIMWMFLLGLASFGALIYPPSNIDGRLGFIITMILTIVAFQFVISSSLPNVPYLTFIDKYNFLIFALNLVLMLETFIVGYYEAGIVSNPDAADRTFAIIYIVLFISGHIVFIIYARILYKREINKIGQKLQINYNIISDWSENPAKSFSRMEMDQQ